MSASSILTAIVNQLSGSAFFGTPNVAQDYGVLEIVDASAVVVEMQGVSWNEDVFSLLSEATWTVSIKGYSKDTGDPKQVMLRTITIMDTVASCIRSDSTFGGAVTRTRSLNLSRSLPPGGFVIAGGATWQESPFTMQVEEWPDG